MIATMVEATKDILAEETWQTPPTACALAPALDKELGILFTLATDDRCNFGAVFAGCRSLSFFEVLR